ncbi:phage Gp37/Gp68 family protein [Hymenobacter mucosus]|uniref:Protein gp37 n=1 Tax=Hymenobacter mucosus TaxID=1411120 RepID=A0A238ZWB9_9BACT|nr:phage Gp37/Gp68 family protein [Hymenobacter mucosus]SNR87539.1 protein gp37 [Hymenobacter mucosus]
MGRDTTIEWAHHTFNPWRGCEKVSAGCKNCYAETQSKRNPLVLGEWGPAGRRAPAAENYWKLPLQWNEEAQQAGERRRVFCLSLGDVFEDRDELRPWRLRLLMLIRETPHLDWLLLTKRPELTLEGLSYAFATSPFMHPVGPWLYNWINGEPPANVFLGTSVENQTQADIRLQWLLSVPAVLHFVSMEPLLGPVDLTRIRISDEIFGFRHPLTGCTLPALETAEQSAFDHPANVLPYCLDWVIVGGESGAKARPIHPDWVRSLQQQCHEAQVSFMFKQWGEFVPQGQLCGGDYGINGNQPWLPEDSTWLWRLGKKAAGRHLDCQLYDAVPDPVEADTEPE